MAGISVGDIVFVRFPFSDLSQHKLRPALVLAKAGNDDSILCQITSRPYADTQAIVLQQDSLARGHLRKVSYVRPAKLFTANIGIVVKAVAHVKPKLRQAVVNQIMKLLNAESE